MQYSKLRYKAICENNISIILFFDGASFNKGLTGEVWAVFGMVANLPPLIRTEFFNMIKFIFISGKSFALNSLLDNHLANLSSLLRDGLEIKQFNMKLIVYIHSVIADAPARAKICNTKQFNGEFGCIHCMNKGVLIGRTRIYKGIEFTERTNALYIKQLEHCTNRNIEKYGIKGKSILENFKIKIPTDVLNDYMHSCL